MMFDFDSKQEFVFVNSSYTVYFSTNIPTLLKKTSKNLFYCKSEVMTLNLKYHYQSNNSKHNVNTDAHISTTWFIRARLIYVCCLTKNISADF